MSDAIFTLLISILTFALGAYVGYMYGSRHHKELITTINEALKLIEDLQVKYLASKLYKDKVKHLDNMPGTDEEKQAVATTITGTFDTVPDKEPAGFNGTPN